MTLGEYLDAWAGDIRLFPSEQGIQIDRLYPSVMAQFPIDDPRWAHARQLKLDAEGYAPPKFDGKIQVYSAGIHYGEEAQLPRPVGAVFFRKCRMNCTFCSDQADVQTRGPGISQEELGRLLTALEASGVGGIDLVNPDAFTSDILETIHDLEVPLPPIIWNTHGYKIQGQQALAISDIVCLDMKFSSDVARRLSSARGDYLEVVTDFLDLAKSKLGGYDPTTKQGVFVRYLVMPGQVLDSRLVFEAVASVDPTIPVNIMDQYLPVVEDSGLPQRSVTDEEVAEVHTIAKRCGLTNIWTQGA